MLRAPSTGEGGGGVKEISNQTDSGTYFMSPEYEEALFYNPELENVKSRYGK